MTDLDVVPSSNRWGKATRAVPHPLCAEDNVVWMQAKRPLVEALMDAPLTEEWVTDQLSQAIESSLR